MAENNSIKNKILSDLEANVDPRYRGLLLDSGDLGGILGGVEASLEGRVEQLCPPPEGVFNAFKLTKYKNLRVIIVGQDPYTNGHAMGLAFASSDVTLPPSLKQIFECLVKQGIIGQVPPNGDLTGWAHQGMLLINKTLTAAKNKAAGAHRKIWAGYINAFIDNLCKAKSHSLLFILWGNDAINCEKIVGKYARHGVLKWQHPSPLANNKYSKANPAHFVNCTNFTDANMWLAEHGRKPINWAVISRADREAKLGVVGAQNNEPTPANIYIATDGACTGNGTPRGVCSGAFVVYDDQLVPCEIGGQGLIYSFAKKVPGVGTNNIGELHAIIWAFEYLLDNDILAPNIYLVTDSRYCLLALNYDDPVAKKAAVVKNRALVGTLIDLHMAVKSKYGSRLILRHQRAHKRLVDIPKADQIFWAGNYYADKLASGSL